MANYYSMGRTNYFAVNDEDLFKEKIVPLVESHDGQVWEEVKDGQTLYAIGFPDGFPSQFYDEDSGDEYEIEWESVIREFLSDGWVCIIQEIGWEKLRYLSGGAIAFDNTGKRVSVNVYDIVKMAQENIGGIVTQPEY